MTTFLFLLNLRRDSNPPGVRLLGFLHELKVLKDEKGQVFNSTFK